MVAAVSLRSPFIGIPKQSYTSKKVDKQKVPHCISCNRCKNNICEYFDRYVDKNYNKCIMHTLIVPTPNLKYVSPPESYFKELQRKEAARLKKLRNNE